MDYVELDLREHMDQYTEEASDLENIKVGPQQHLLSSLLNDLHFPADKANPVRFSICMYIASKHL